MKSKMSLRVQSQLWEDDAQFAIFLESMSRLDAFEEYALFTHDAHTPPPLPVMLRRAELIKDRITALRAIAPRVGINHLCTLGHADEDLEWARSNSGRLFRGIDGRQTPGNFCPRDPVWRNGYIAPVYRALAASGTDFIWIDDDVRLENHGPGVQYGCFCDDCFAALKQYFGFAGTLEDFRRSFDGDAGDQALRARRMKMLEWNRMVELDLLQFIEQNVHGVNPRVVLGRMDGADFWSGCNRVRQAEVLRGKGNSPVRWRPGGGVYTDFAPDAIVHKANGLGTIAAQLPPWIDSIDSEIENFPYRNGAKSNRFTCLETAVYCAAGCTGTVLNVIGDSRWSPVSEYEGLVRTLKEQKPFNDRIVEKTAGLPPCGVWDGVDGDYFMGTGVGAAHWIGMPERPLRNMRIGFHAIGLPRAYRAADCMVAALGEAEAAALSDETLMALFAKGLYLDAEALSVLCRRGFQRYVGFRPGAQFTRDAIESSLPHLFNPMGFQVNIRQSFWGGVATALEPPSDAQVLTRLVDYHDRLLAPCASGCWVNELGGRIFATGYGAWEFPGYIPKYRQLHAVFQWLSHDGLPAAVLDGHFRTTLWTRMHDDGTLSACLLNVSLDPARGLPIRLKTPCGSLRIIRKGRADEVIAAASREGDFALFRLPEADDLELLLLIAENGG